MLCNNIRDSRCSWVILCPPLVSLEDLSHYRFTPFKSALLPSPRDGPSNSCSFWKQDFLALGTLWTEQVNNKSLHTKWSVVDVHRGWGIAENASQSLVWFMDRGTAGDRGRKSDSSIREEKVQTTSLCLLTSPRLKTECLCIGVKMLPL